MHGPCRCTTRLPVASACARAEDGEASPRARRMDHADRSARNARTRTVRRGGAAPWLGPRQRRQQRVLAGGPAVVVAAPNAARTARAGVCLPCPALPRPAHLMLPRTIEPAGDRQVRLPRACRAVRPTSPRLSTHRHRSYVSISPVNLFDQGQGPG
jgi:hypothetical protein